MRKRVIGSWADGRSAGCPRWMCLTTSARPRARTVGRRGHSTGSPARRCQDGGAGFGGGGAAMRLHGAPDATGLFLAATITGDRDAEVRAAGLFAAGFRHFDELATQWWKLPRENPVDRVRSEGRGSASRYRDTSPGIQEALARIAARPPKRPSVARA